MAAFCRICGPNNKQDVQIVCQCCGSHVCDAHTRWFASSKQAYCDVCFPRPARQGAAQLADALAILAYEQLDSPDLQKLAQSIQDNTELKQLLRHDDGVLETMAQAVRRLEIIFTSFDFPDDNPSNLL